MKASRTILSSIFITMAFAFGILGGCKKDDLENQIDNEKYRVTSINKNYGDDYVIQNIFYDSIGRQIKHIWRKNGSVEYVTTYTYMDSTIIMNSIQEYKLNSEGLASSLNGFHFTYDSEGHLIKEQRGDPEKGQDWEIVTHIWEKGNLVHTMKKGAYYSICSESYVHYQHDYNYSEYMDKPNTIGNENMGLAWLGKDNKNPLTEQRWSYEYDSLNRIISRGDRYDVAVYYYYIEIK